MSLLGRVRRILRDEGVEADPDEFVELITVPQMNGPLLLHGLGEQTIAAQGRPTFNPVLRTMDVRIMVRRKDMVVALHALRDLGFSDV